MGNITWRKLPVMLPFILKISRLRTTSPNHQLTTTRSNIWLKYIFGLHMNHMKKTSFQWRTCCSDTTFLLKGSKYHGFISYLFKRGGLKKDDRFRQPTLRSKIHQFSWFWHLLFLCPFHEDLYTIALNLGEVPMQQQRDAARIAFEIESGLRFSSIAKRDSRPKNKHRKEPQVFVSTCIDI